MKRELTPAEMDALEALMQGKVQPLAKVIADLLIEGQSDLHPLLLQQLYLMLEGSASKSDWRLVAKRHPDLRRNQSKTEKAANAARAHRSALLMALNGAFAAHSFEAAVQATMEKTGLKRSTIIAHWSEHKDFVKMEIEQGIIRREDVLGMENVGDSSE